MTAPQVFLCYQFREKEVATALAASLSVTNQPLDAYDQRMRIQVSSDDAAPLKSGLEAAIALAGATVALVGPTTATSSWVNWELAHAISLGKPVVVARVDAGDTLPDAVATHELILSTADPASILEAISAL